MEKKPIQDNNLIDKKEVEPNVQLSLELDKIQPLDTKTGDEEEIKSKEQEEKQIQESEQAVSKQKSKKSKIFQLSFFIANIVVVIIVLWIQLSNEQVVPLSYLIDNIKIPYLLLTFLIFWITVANLAIAQNSLIKQNTNKSRFCLAYKSSVLSRYYDSITPLSSGGEPYEIYYLKSHGLSPAASIAVPMSKYCIGQIAWMTLSTIILLMGYFFNLGIGSTIIGVASYIGFGFNALLLIATIWLSISKKVGKIIVIKILKFLQKIKILKDYEKQYQKVMNIVSDYQTTMRAVVKDFWRFLWVFFLYLTRFVAIYSIPFFIYCSFFGFDGSVFLEIVTTSFLIDLASSFMPMPSGTGITEISFTALLGTIFGGSIFWAMLLWRIFNFYGHVIQGVIVLSYDYFVGNKKYKWQQKKWELEAESNAFKKEQLMNYRKNQRKSKLKENKSV